MLLAGVQDPAQADRAEQLEVAKECLCDAFEMDPADPGETTCSLSDAWAAVVRLARLVVCCMGHCALAARMERAEWSRMT